MFPINKNLLSAEVSLLKEEGDDDSPEMNLKVKTVLSQFEKLVELGKGVPKEVYSSIAAIPKACRLSDSVAAHIDMTLAIRQQLLELNNVSERLDYLTNIVAEALELLDVEKRVQGRVRTQVEKSQRHYYLSEKIKAIQKEMGDLDESGLPANELEDLEKKENE